MPFSKGQTVKQMVHPIQGEIISKRFNEDSNSFEYLVTYLDPDGNAVERWFTESEVEAV